MLDEIETIHQLFIEAIADASEKFKNAEVETSENTSQSKEVKYSIATDRQGSYVKVDVNQDVFNGKNTREMQEIARKLIKENFKGKVLSVGADGKAYINKRSAEEYAYPANRRMDDSIKEVKMRSSAELDNLLAISEFVENQPDDGRHPQATGGWDVYTTRFEVANKMFIGEVKIMVTDRGYVFYDITKIKRLPVNGGQTEIDSVAASGNLSNDIISNSVKNVNTSISENGVKYSFAGREAKTSDIKTLETAIRLEDVGKATSEEIRQQTGWFRGMDGKWRFEISDRDIEIDTTGKFHTNPDVRRYMELFDKVFVNMNASEEEATELRSLDENLKGVSFEPRTLGELIKHDKLFAAYPQLKEISVHFADIDERGIYDPISKILVLQSKLKLDKSKLEKTLIHEIQHAIQDIEGFASGSSPDSWQVAGVSKEDAYGYYERTAGEIEARDAATRSWRSDEARKEKRPDIDRTDVVFADVKYSDRNFVEDKYFSRQIDKFETLKQGGYITVGKITGGSPLNMVGIPEGNLYFDVSKIVHEMAERNDPIPKDKMKEIPKVLDNPIVITEYVDNEGNHSANVYGEIFVGSSPVVIGVMIAKSRNGNIVSKIQTVHPNRNVLKEMVDDNILYLSEDKKETKSYFQALGTHKLPFGGKRFGFIRTISQISDVVKRFSDRDPNALTPRNLLANALEESAVHEVEKKKLAEYKDNIEKLYAKEQELYEVRKEIKELSFAPGKRDTAKLKQLQEKATKLSNNVTLYDKKLLTLESTSFLKNVLEREKAKAIKKQKEKDAERLKAQKEKALQREKEITERYQASRKKAVESRNKTAMRNKIKRVVNELNQYLLSGNKVEQSIQNSVNVRSFLPDSTGNMAV